MIIQCDTRQKMGQKHHQIKEQWFIDNGHEVIRSKCLIGDYVCPSNGSVAVDTKQSPSELYSDLIQDHVRFRNECLNAQRYGIKLYILVENTHGFKALNDLHKWKNPLWYRYWQAKKKGSNQKPPATNLALIKIMYSMNKKYGVEFLFCSTEEAGAKIVALLGGQDG